MKGIVVQMKKTTSITNLYPLLKAFFCTEPIYTNSWANKKLVNTQDKPEFSLLFSPWKQAFTILICEVKPEKTVSVQKDGCISNLVKISKQMKTSLEDMVKAGVTGAMSFGILCKGWSISLLVMDIDHEAMYRLYEPEKLDLTRSSTDSKLY